MKMLGEYFFVYGFGGTGKTFLWKKLTTSSGIASLLLEGGRTAHSIFGIPLNPIEFTTCNMKAGSYRTNLVKEASLIIWDEGLSDSEAEDIKEFSKWILAVGDGRIVEPNDGEALIDIPSEFLITKAKDPIEAICTKIYGDITKIHEQNDPVFFKKEQYYVPPTKM